MRDARTGGLAIMVAAMTISCAAAGPAAAAKTAKPVKRAKLADRARNADKVGGLRASRTPRAGRLLALGKDGKFPASVLPLTPAPLPSGGGSLGGDLAALLAPYQRQIVASCTPGSAIRAVAADGSVTCEPAAHTAGAGLVLADRAFSIDPAATQRRVSGVCAAGSAMRAVAEDGTTTCEAFGDITQVAAGTGLTGGSASGTATLGIAVPLELTGGGNQTTARFTATGSGNALHAVTGATGQGSAVVGHNGGVDNYGGAFEITNAANPRAAVYARTAGNGQAIDAEVNANTNGDALFARTTSSSASSYAGIFVGNVSISGNLAKSSGSFLIDHPLDPANRYLQHSFVESPDMKNVYDGVVTTDGDGYATVELPSYFQALNRDFRYQLTPHRSFSRATVWEEIDGNRFTIRTEDPGVRVSWQVTGIREDAWAEAHRIPVESDKPPAERGRYLAPEEHGAPAERVIGRR